MILFIVAWVATRFMRRLAFPLFIAIVLCPAGSISMSKKRRRLREAVSTVARGFNWIKSFTISFLAMESFLAPDADQKAEITEMLLRR
jgi:hypothetical protein